MKNIFWTLVLVVPILANAQVTREQMKEAIYSKPTLESVRKNHPNACHFYKTAADYYADKPVANIDWTPYSYSMLAGTEKIEVVNNGKAEKVKLADLPTDWASDEHGMLMRRVDKKMYIVVVDGPLSYYILFKEGNATANDNGTYTFGTGDDGKYLDYFSETLNGEMSRRDSKILKPYLAKYNLQDQYNADKPKREMHDSVAGFMFKGVARDVKYIKLINEQLAKK